ncbi:MAG TPA: hypothetical protein VJB66_00900 [Candidatus Nanoarchaeia archaeon]|nr:hypothetical protein [Candidatus Nanoarchaeia archaeon]
MKTPQELKEIEQKKLEEKVKGDRAVKAQIERDISRIVDRATAQGELNSSGGTIKYDPTYAGENGVQWATEYLVENGWNVGYYRKTVGREEPYFGLTPKE